MEHPNMVDYFEWILKECFRLIPPEQQWGIHIINGKSIKTEGFPKWGSLLFLLTMYQNIIFSDFPFTTRMNKPCSPFEGAGISTP